MKLCLSIAPASMPEALSILKSVKRTADVVEVRIDGIPDLDLASLLRKPRPKVIITNRRVGEGGKFMGSADEQLETLQSASRLGADYVDLEMSWGADTVSKFIASVRKSGVILSYHNFAETPDDLHSLYATMHSMGVGVLKIATLARSINDNLKMFELCNVARKDRQSIIALCMDERGEISRILGGKYGSLLTFGSRNRSESTAPGQRTIDDLRKVFRVHTISIRTKIFGLLGNPVSHSEGIFFHNRIFAAKSVKAVYVNFLVDDLGTFMPAFRGMFSGISVTMPFKRAIIPFLDVISPDATTIGSVNTVLHRENKLRGYNTDFTAISSLLKNGVSRAKKVAVLGTGGTARTMAYAAISRGGHTTIVGRSSQNASALAGELGCDFTTFENLSQLECDVLLNGTSVGMGSTSGDERVGQIVPPAFLHRGMLVFDAVYDPPVTRLLLDAQSAGCRTISGLELFSRQARLQSKLFMDCI